MRKSKEYQKWLTHVEEKYTPLPDKPEETARGILDALWSFVAGNPMSIERSAQQPLEELSEEGKVLLETLIQRKLSHVPLAHLTQRQQFMDIEFIVNGDALVPRKETELLGTSALSCISSIANRQGEATVIDVCTGMGNLALAFAHYEPKAKIFASDISEKAIELAELNRQRFALTDRVHFSCGDFLRPFENATFLNRVDVLTCNPPYISSKQLEAMPDEITKFEPGLAFDGGPFGVKFLLRLVNEAALFIRPGGWLCFEVGEGQGDGMVHRIQNTKKYSDIRKINDKSETVRAILAQRACN